MNNAQRKTDIVNTMDITVHGYKVALYFADEPNPQVAVQVKQALLSVCIPVKQ